MHSERVDLNPYEDEWGEIRLSDEVVKSYSLDEWSRAFSLMTAGYRDQLDPEDANNPQVAFNLVTVAILGEAKARVFERKPERQREIAHVHVGGETRPHTQEFIGILSRIYAAHDMKVHLRARVRTTPIWYSSFGVFYEQYQSGDNLTASHSQFFKGGWKPMDSEGKQLLEEEEEIVAEARNIVKSRATIRLAPWLSSENILRDFDVDAAYVSYQESVLGKPLIAEIQRAARAGFRCAACPVGGSMKATTERLFELMGIPTGEDGVIQYFLGEEDSHYHGVGQIDGQNHGTDPGKWQIYRNIGAQQILLSNKASVVFIWDPDGDRFNIVTIASLNRAKQAAELGLEIESGSDSERCIVYFTPNQIFFMATAYRIFALKKVGLLNEYDWFITRSVSTTHALDELAALEDIPVADVRVGFKYMGTFAEWVENRVDANQPFITPTGNKVRLGERPRPLIMCEESGGAIFGGADFLWNKNHTRGMLTLREKDGLELALFTLSLAAFLHNSGQSFADFYCERITKNDIKNKYFNRRDVLLYDESLVGEDRQAAKEAGITKRDQVMAFFQVLAERFASGGSLDKMGDEINSRLAENDKPLPRPKKICYLGDGTLIECDTFWYVIRASGTDAVLRYYIEGKDREELDAAQKSLINMRI
jgi:phosphomannomutase